MLFKREFSNEVAKTMTMVIDLGSDLLITIFIVVISTGLSLYFVASDYFCLENAILLSLPYHSASEVTPEILPRMSFGSQLPSYSTF